jgi:hypothetical protein
MRIEPTYAVINAGWVVNLQVGVVDKVGGPARVVKRTANAVKTVKDADRVRRKRDCYYNGSSEIRTYASN